MYDYCYICSDHIYDCDYICQALDEDSLMRKVSDHLLKEYNLRNFNSETRRQIRGAYKEKDELKIGLRYENESLPKTEK